MGDRGGKSYEYSGETTEWEDILVKKGVVTRDQVFLAKGLDPRQFPEKGAATEQEQEEVPDAKTLKEDRLAHASLEELDEAEDDDLDDDRMLQEYREKRIRELKEKAAKERYGDVIEINKADWVAEVTEASKHTWVVAHLYKDSVIECRILEEVLQVVSRRFRAVKFVKIISTAAIENWPDRNLPTLFVYHDGDLKGQQLTIKSLGGRSVTPEDVEWFLAGLGAVDTEMEENPRKEGGSVRRVERGRGKDSDEEYDSDRC